MKHVLMFHKIPEQEHSCWSIVDQVVVSGSNFLLGIMLARSLGIEAFGLYVVAQMYLLYSNTLQTSIVTTPMMTVIPITGCEKSQFEKIRGYFALCIAVILGAALGVVAVSWGVGNLLPSLSLGELIVPLIFAIFGFQVHDWMRKYLYIEQRNRTVLFFDCIGYLGQVVGILFLIWADMLTSISSLWVLAFCFIFSSCLFLLWKGVYPDFFSCKKVLLEHWGVSKDLLINWQFQWVGSQGVILIGSGMVGPHAVGAIRAVQNLLGPVNVAYQWMDNVVSIRAMKVYKELGLGALIGYLVKVSFVGVFINIVLLAFLFFVGEMLMVVFFGEAYHGYYYLVLLQGFYFLILLLYRLGGYYFRAIGKTREIAISGFYWAAVSVVVLILFVVIGYLEVFSVLLAVLSGLIAAVFYFLVRSCTLRF